MSHRLPSNELLGYFQSSAEADSLICHLLPSNELLGYYQSSAEADSGDASQLLPSNKLLGYFQSSAEGGLARMRSHRLFIFLKILLDRVQQASFQVVKLKLIRRNWLPLAWNQHLRVDERVDGLLQAVRLELTFHRHHFFDNYR